MSNDRKLDWPAAGVSAVELTNQLMKTLVAKGVITEDERGQVIDRAIATLEAAPAHFHASAHNLRVLFRRPK
jgi:hypothetical protein